MDFVFILLGINTLFVFLFKREWLLQKHSFFIMLICNFILCIFCYVLQYHSIGNPKLVVALKMPVISQVLFVIFVFVFRKLYDRNPVDTFWTMDSTLMKDGIFNFVFWFLAIMLPAYLVFEKVI